MVKGLAKRVIVVKSPDKRFFEEAIFILREDARDGVSAQDIVAQASRIAAQCISSSSPAQRLLRPALYCLASAVFGALGFLLFSLIM